MFCEKLKTCQKEKQNDKAGFGLLSLLYNKELERDKTETDWINDEPGGGFTFLLGPFAL